MTQEEAKLVLDSLSTWVGQERLITDEIVEAIRTLSQPSLPSNLDEAANDGWALYEYRESPKGLYSNCYIDGFKAGAEWMAGQGYTKEGIARPDDCEVWVNFTSTDIKDGDEVIVQIRKK